MSNPENRETVPWEQFIDTAEHEGVTIKLQENGQYKLSGKNGREWVGDFVNPCIRSFIFEQAGRFGINPAIFFRAPSAEQISEEVRKPESKPRDLT